MSLLLSSFGLSGYRSFGDKPQRFESLAKVTVLIGRNNSGKSNVIRFLHDCYRKLSASTTLTLDELDKHTPNVCEFRYGTILLRKAPTHEDVVRFQPQPRRGVSGYELERCSATLQRVFDAKRAEDGTAHVWSFASARDGSLESEAWFRALRTVSDNEIELVWSALTGQSGGSFIDHWAPQLTNLFRPQLQHFPLVVVPAFRQIGTANQEQPGVDGAGIITQLARLQDPTVQNQGDRQRFLEIQAFVREVMESSSVEINIPHDRKTINVRMDGRLLPIESLGTGIHEVVILAAAATVHTNTLICIEEPELHLNPTLQRKLTQYLTANTTNQYIITTHSASIMDTPDAEIYHLKLIDGSSVVERVTSDSRRTLVCEDLGYHPSDLLQANCVVWVEGLSDRLYVKYWLRAKAPNAIEGVHFSVMFYGGKLASHVTNELDEQAADDLIQLRKLNRRGVIIMDSDKSKRSSSINATKSRLQIEFDNGPGHAWVSEGREIENHLPESHLRAALDQSGASFAGSGTGGKFSNLLVGKRSNGQKVVANKVKIAHYVTDHFQPDFSRFDLGEQVERLVSFITNSNPQLLNRKAGNPT